MVQKPIYDEERIRASASPVKLFLLPYSYIIAVSTCAVALTLGIQDLYGKVQAVFRPHVTNDNIHIFGLQWRRIVSGSNLSSIFCIFVIITPQLQLPCQWFNKRNQSLRSVLTFLRAPLAAF